jgi:hypothetical protein
MRYVKFEWTTTEQHSKIVKIADDVDLMNDDHDFENGLAEIEDDNSFDGCERSDIHWDEITDTTSRDYATAVLNAEEWELPE